MAQYGHNVSIIFPGNNLNCALAGISMWYSFGSTETFSFIIVSFNKRTDLFVGGVVNDCTGIICPTIPRIILAVVTLSFNTLSMGFVRGIKLLNSQAVCTVITKEGETFDCLVFVGSNGQDLFYINQSSLSGQLQSISFDRGSLKSVFTLKPDGTESYQTF